MLAWSERDGHETSRDELLKAGGGIPSLKRGVEAMSEAIQPCGQPPAGALRLAAWQSALKIQARSGRTLGRSVNSTGVGIGAITGNSAALVKHESVCCISFHADASRPGRDQRTYRIKGQCLGATTSGSFKKASTGDGRADSCRNCFVPKRSVAWWLSETKGCSHTRGQSTMGVYDRDYRYS